MKLKIFIIAMITALILFSACETKNGSNLTDNTNEEKLEKENSEKKEEKKEEKEEEKKENTDEKSENEIKQKEKEEEKQKENEEKQKDDEPVEGRILEIEEYRELLENYSKIISKRVEMITMEGIAGVFEQIYIKKVDEALESIGYSIQDISGDGVPELLIVIVSEKEDNKFKGHETIAIYTIKDKKAHLTQEGWARSRFIYQGDGKYYYQGSAGAMYSFLGKFTISKTGDILECNDFYFTSDKDDNPEEKAYYRNTLGTMDTPNSEELNISENEFWNIAKEMSEEPVNIELIPFSRYEEKLKGIDSSPEIRVNWAGTEVESYENLHEFVLDRNESSVRLLFTANKTVKDFKFLNLEVLDTSQDGKMKYKIKEVYELEKLTPQKPFLATVVYYGDLTTYGISYHDDSGDKVVYAVSVSGEDGEISLKRIEQ